MPNRPIGISRASLLLSLIGWIACTDSEAPIRLKAVHPDGIQRTSEGLLPRYQCGKLGHSLGIRLEMLEPGEHTWELAGSLRSADGATVELPQCLDQWQMGKTRGPGFHFCEVDLLKDNLIDCAKGTDGSLSIQVSITSEDSRPSKTYHLTQKILFTHDPLIDMTNPCAREIQSALEARKDPRSETRLDPFTLQEMAISRSYDAVKCLMNKGLQQVAYLERRMLLNYLRLNGYPPEKRLELVRDQVSLVDPTDELQRIRLHYVTARFAMDANNFGPAKQEIQAILDKSLAMGSEEGEALAWHRFAQWGQETGDPGLSFLSAGKCIQHANAQHYLDLLPECMRLLVDSYTNFGLDGKGLLVFAETIHRVFDATKGPLNEERWYYAYALGRFLLTLEEPAKKELNDLITSLRSVVKRSEGWIRLQSILEELPDPNDPNTNTTLVAKMLGEAVFEDVAAAYSTERNSDLAMNGYAHVAWSRLRAGDVHGAREFLTKADRVPSATVPEQERNSMRGREYLLASAGLALRETNVRDAVRQIQEVLTHPEIPLEVLTIWERHVMEGQLLEKLGKYAEAKIALREAVRTLRAEATRTGLTGHAIGFLRLGNRRILDELLMREGADNWEAWLEDFQQGTSITQQKSDPDNQADLSKSDAYLKYAQKLDELRAFRQDLETRNKEEQKKGKARERELMVEVEHLLEIAMTADASLLPVRAVPKLAQPGSRSARTSSKIADLQALLPADAEVWVIASLPDGTAGVRITGKKLEPFSSTIPRQSLLNARNLVFDALRQKHPQLPPPEALKTLSSMLPGKVSKDGGKLVVILDPLLDGIPVEILSTDAGRVIDQVSALSYVADTETLTRHLRSDPPSWWSVPAFVADSDGSLLSARLSVGQLCKQFSTAQCLTGSSVTLPALVDILEQQTDGSSPLALLVHGESSPLDPASASLLLADRKLNVLDIQGLPLARGRTSLLYLGACDSGAGGASGASLVRAAAAAGAHAIISSRWSLYEKVDTAVFTTVMGGLSEKVAPAEALTRALRGLGNSEKGQVAQASLWLYGDPGWRKPKK